MPTVQFETTVAAPLERVWAFYEDIAGSLPVLMPEEFGLELISVTPEGPPRVGTRVKLTMRGPFGRITWVAGITEYVPPHAVAFGAEGRFVDEQESGGPFKSWRHSHEFESVDSKTTRVLDVITYVPPYPVVGLILDPVMIRPRLRRTFAHRHARLKRLLEGSPRT